MEDEKIIELYFAREESAITETHRKYGAYLNRLAYNILWDSSDTEEIVNDTYMGAWNAMPPRRPSVLRHFLSGITRNLSFNRLDYRMAKRRNRDVELFFSELEDCIPDEKSDVEKSWEALEIEQSLNRFLGILEKRNCAVFLARYYYAETIKEIALQYGLSERQDKYQLARMREQLRAHLAKEGVIL